VFQPESDRIPKRSTSGLRPPRPPPVEPPPTSPRRCLRAFVVSEGVYKIRDLLTMFAPTRVCARLLACVYPVTHKRAVPRRAGPFRRRRPSAPEIHRRYFIPGDFYEPIYHTSTGARRGWRCAAGDSGPKVGARSSRGRERVLNPRFYEDLIPPRTCKSARGDRNFSRSRGPTRIAFAVDKLASVGQRSLRDLRGPLPFERKLSRSREGGRTRGDQETRVVRS